MLAEQPARGSGSPAAVRLPAARVSSSTIAKSLPAVYVIQGYTGQLDMWLSRAAFEPTMIERLDAMFSAATCPDALIVFVDAWTSRGGSQFLNSAATGRYLDYLCDEVVPFVDERYPTRASRDHRGLAGKSSGGYGAMVVPMLRPDVFGALARTPGDALFECCYLPEFREVARTLRDHFEGSYEVFLEQLCAAADHFDYGQYGSRSRSMAMACCYSPDLSARGPCSRSSLDRPPDRRDLGAVARARPGPHGPAPRRRAAQHAPHLPRRRAGRTSTTSTSAPGVRARARKLGVELTRSSCSTASTAAWRIVTPARSASW